MIVAARASCHIRLSRHLIHEEVEQNLKRSTSWRCIGGTLFSTQSKLASGLELRTAGMCNECNATTDQSWETRHRQPMRHASLY